MNNNYKDQVLETLRAQNISITPEEAARIKKNIEKITAYKPTIAFFGKTGVGKSSLINAIFGDSICEVSDVASCTRDIKRLDLKVSGNRSITLIDVPGVAENEARDREYIVEYQKLLEEVDVILWLLKADERAYAPDIAIYNNAIKDHIGFGKPCFFVLNQIDKIEPLREWNLERNAPGPHQLENIDEKIDEVAKNFGIRRDQIIIVSANEKYNLVNLVERMIVALPSEKIYSVAREVRPELITPQFGEVVKKSVIGSVLSGVGGGAAIGAAIGSIIPVVGTVIGGVVGGIIGGISSFFGWFD